jgi:hypothetical protein
MQPLVRGFEVGFVDAFGFRQSYCMRVLGSVQENREGMAPAEASAEVEMQHCLP